MNLKREESLELVEVISLLENNDLEVVLILHILICTK